MTGHNETKIIPSGTTESTAMAAEGWKRELAPTQDLGQATRPTVTEFRGLIRLSMSEAVRYLTPTVQKTTCDRPEAVTAGTDLL
jgi:hypothetical protein